MNQPIELRKLRDFGQIINDSFTFFKQNFKPLFKALIIICGFFILLSVISLVFAYMNIGNVLRFRLNAYDARYSTLSYFISIMINTFISILTQAFIHLVTLCYISVYVQKRNLTPSLAEVWGYFKYYFFRVLGSSILIFFVFCAGFMLCFIPGFYLMPILYLIIPIIVVENTSFRYAFNKSFQLIKNHWWMVFGVLFVMSLIVGIAGSLATFPLTVSTVMGRFLTLKSFTLPLIILFSVIKSVLLLLYVLPAIAICLSYLSLSEEKEGTGLLGRIERFGMKDDNGTLPLEEY